MPWYIHFFPKQWCSNKKLKRKCPYLFYHSMYIFIFLCDQFGVIITNSEGSSVTSKLFFHYKIFSKKKSDSHPLGTIISTPPSANNTWSHWSTDLNLNDYIETNSEIAVWIICSLCRALKCTRRYLSCTFIICHLAMENIFLLYLVWCIWYVSRDLG